MPFPPQAPGGPFPPTHLGMPFSTHPGAFQPPREEHPSWSFGGAPWGAQGWPASAVQDRLGGASLPWACPHGASTAPAFGAFSGMSSGASGPLVPPQAPPERPAAAPTQSPVQELLTEVLGLLRAGGQSQPPAPVEAPDSVSQAAGSQGVGAGGGATFPANPFSKAQICVLEQLLKPTAPIVDTASVDDVVKAATVSLQKGEIARGATSFLKKHMDGEPPRALRSRAELLARTVQDL